MRWFGCVQKKESNYIGRKMPKMKLLSREQSGRLKKRFMGGHLDSWYESRRCRRLGDMKKDDSLWRNQKGDVRRFLNRIKKKISTGLDEMIINGQIWP